MSCDAVNHGREASMAVCIVGSLEGALLVLTVIIVAMCHRLVYNTQSARLTAKLS